MLITLLEDPRVVAPLTAILGLFLAHIIWLRKWHLEKKHHASQLADERARQDRLRFLNDLSKDYSALMLAINEIHIQTQSIPTKLDIVNTHRTEAIKALANINNTAPHEIVDAANGVWHFAVLIFNQDQRYATDILEAALWAYLCDFHALVKIHLAGKENVVLQPDTSEVDFLAKTCRKIKEELPRMMEDKR